MSRILCATDLLPKSEAAIDRAGVLAAELEAAVSLLHVVAPTGSEHALEQALQNAIGQMKSRARPPLWRYGPTPNVLVRTGIPARQIVDTIMHERADILAVGHLGPRAASRGIARSDCRYAGADCARV